MKIFFPVEGYPNYENALSFCGAEVCREHPEDCAALLLPGGEDIAPALYGQENAGSRDVNPERDRRETQSFQLFLELERPILGICRGAQLINALLGGTLHQDIPGHSRVEGEDRLHGSFTVDPLLISLYGERIPVNSSHHQAIDRLGEGLRIVQWADDGTVEAIRHESLPIFAVQWHPERLREPTDGWRLIAAWLETIC